MKKLKNRGFTLVEVVAIIIVLAAIFLVVFPVILNESKKAKNREYNQMVDILCDAGKSYIYTVSEDTNISTEGDKTTVLISDLVEQGIVDSETKNPKNDTLVSDDRLLFEANEDLSLSCTLQTLEKLPIPTADNACNSNMVYTGNEINLVKNPNSNVTYQNSRATNAGSYTVTASIDPYSTVIWTDKTTENKTFTCSIAKADDQITITHTTREYTGIPMEATVTTRSGLPTNKTYYSDNTCTTVATPLNYGTYYVIAETAGNNNYNPATSSCTKAITIAKVVLAANVTCDESKIYDGTRNANCSIDLSRQNTNYETTGTCLYSDANVGTNKTITCSNLAIVNDDINNYTIDENELVTTGNIHNAKLVFNANSGTLNGTSPLYIRKGQSGVYTGLTNSTAGTIPTATRTGYTFEGWNSPAGIKIINADKTLVSNINGWVDNNGKWLLTSNQTLTASWEKGVYAITLDKQNGTGGTNTIYEKYDTAYYLYYTNGAVSNYMTAGQNPVETPTREGYVFGGYYTAQNGGGTQYIDANGKITSNASATQFSSNGTLYAKWTAGVYAITLDKQNGTGGTNTIYEKYDTGFYLGYSNGAVSNYMTAGQNPVEIPTREGYVFGGYYTAQNGGGTQYIDANGKITNDASATQFSSNGTLYAKWTDTTKPTTTITGGTALKTATQSVTLKCSDGAGVTAYYFGTTNPTSVSSITTTTSLSSLTDNGLSQNITAAGTYYLACRDAAGNFEKTSIVIRKYEVQNVLLNIDGTAATYTSDNYTAIGTAATYYVKEGTTLTLSNVYTTTNATGSFRGYTTAAPSATAQTPSTTSPTAPNNNTTRYYMWFYRTTFTVTLNASKGGSLKADRIDFTGSATAPAEGSNTITVRYGEKVKATATPATGYSLSEFTGGYISGSTSPTTGAAITEDKTITASFTPNVYTVTLDKQNGTGGTETIYEKYNTGFYLGYSNGAVSNYMTAGQNGITIPTRDGYTYIGHFTSTSGNGNQYINTNGRIISGVSTTQFTNNNGKLYAYWTKDNYQVGTKKYQTLETAYDACSSYFSEGDTCTIKVIASNTDSSQIIVEEGNSVIINTNGLTVTKTTSSIINKGNLTLTGSGIITASTVHTINNSNGGTLTVNGPTVRTTASTTYYPIYNDGSNFTLTSGTISSTSIGAIYSGNVTINGGTVTLTNNNTVNVRVINTSGSVKMTGGTINISRTNSSTTNTTAYTTIGINKTGTGALTITGGTITSNCNLTKAGTSNNGCYGITLSGNSTENAISGLRVTTTSTGDSASYGLNLTAGTTITFGNGNNVTSTNMGILASGTAIFSPVTSSSYIGQGSYGIYMASANANVTIGSGNNITGTSAIGLTSAVTSGGLTINGGTITGTSTYAVSNASASPVTITDGELTSPNFVVYNSSSGVLTFGKNDGDISVEYPYLHRTANGTSNDTSTAIYNKNGGTDNTTYIYDGLFEISRFIVGAPETTGYAAIYSPKVVIPGSTSQASSNTVNMLTSEGSNCNNVGQCTDSKSYIIPRGGTPNMSITIANASTYTKTKTAKITITGGGSRKLKAGTYTFKYAVVASDASAPACSSMSNTASITVSGTTTQTASTNITVGSGLTGSKKVYVCNSTAIQDTSSSLAANTSRSALFNVDNTPPTISFSISGSQVSGTGTTTAKGYVAGEFKIIAACSDSHSGPSELKNTNSGSTTRDTASNSRITLSTAFNNYSSAANVPATCVDKAGNSASGTSDSYIVYRKFQLDYSKNGSDSISKTSETPQYLLSNDTAHAGGHKYTLPTISRKAVGFKVKIFGWHVSSTSLTAIWYNSSVEHTALNNLTATWNDSISVDVYYGTDSSTTSRVYASSNYAAVRTLYAISYDTIPSTPEIVNAIGTATSYYYQPGTGKPGNFGGQYATNDTNVELIDDTTLYIPQARLYNTRRQIYAVRGICDWALENASINTSAALYNGNTEIHHDTRQDVLVVPLGNFTKNNWRCVIWEG